MTLNLLYYFKHILLRSLTGLTPKSHELCFHKETLAWKTSIQTESLNWLALSWSNQNSIIITLNKNSFMDVCFFVCVIYILAQTQ